MEHRYLILSNWRLVSFISSFCLDHRFLAFLCQHMLVDMLSCKCLILNDVLFKIGWRLKSLYPSRTNLGVACHLPCGCAQSSPELEGGRSLIPPGLPGPGKHWAWAAWSGTGLPGHENLHILHPLTPFRYANKVMIYMYLPSWPNLFCKNNASLIW